MSTSANPTIADMISGFSAHLTPAPALPAPVKAETPELAWKVERNPETGTETAVAEHGAFTYAVKGRPETGFKVRAYGPYDADDLGAFAAIWRAFEAAERHAAGAFGAK